MDHGDVGRAARNLLNHRDRGRTIGSVPEADRPAGIAEGYAIQAEAERILREERGVAAIGFKIGATSALARELLGVPEPFFGRLYDATTHESPADLPAGANFFRVHEPEVAVRIGRDLDPAAAPFDAAAIEAATCAVLPAVEVIGCHFDPWMEAGAANLISDNAAHGRWVAGAAVTDWSGIDLLDCPVSLRIDGETAARGRGRNVDGGAFGATAWLANTLAAMGRGLKAGDHVTTGTVAPPPPAAPGQEVTADFGPLGAVTLRIGME